MAGHAFGFAARTLWSCRIPTSRSWDRRAWKDARPDKIAPKDGAELVASTFALGLGSRAAQHRLAAAIAAGGFDDESVQRATAVLLHFVLGHVLHEQQRQQYRDLGVQVDGIDEPRQDEASDAEFVFGVELLVGGLQLRRGHG